MNFLTDLIRAHPIAFGLLVLAVAFVFVFAASVTEENK